MTENECYKVLGVPKNASWWAIKKAFRHLAKKYHPDRAKDSEEIFKQITAAYNFLKESKVQRGVQSTKKASSNLRQSCYWGRGLFQKILDIFVRKIFSFCQSTKKSRKFVAVVIKAKKKEVKATKSHIMQETGDYRGILHKGKNNQCNNYANYSRNFQNFTDENLKHIHHIDIEI